MPPDAEDWESPVAHFWSTVDLEDRHHAIAAMQELATERGPEDPDALFELGEIYDSTGFEAEANAHYAAARDLGLSGARLAQLNIQQGRRFAIWAGSMRQSQCLSRLTLTHRSAT